MKHRSIIGPKESRTVWSLGSTRLPKSGEGLGCAAALEFRASGLAEWSLMRAQSALVKKVRTKGAVQTSMVQIGCPPRRSR